MLALHCTALLAIKIRCSVSTVPLVASSWVRLVSCVAKSAKMARYWRDSTSLRTSAACSDPELFQYVRRGLEDEIDRTVVDGWCTSLSATCKLIPRLTCNNNVMTCIVATSLLPVNVRTNNNVHTLRSLLTCCLIFHYCSLVHGTFFCLFTA